MALKARMISVTGNRSNHAKDRVGFTLIEIVLVLGLIAFASTVLIINFASIADREDTLTTEETLFAAIRKARFFAASKRATTQLRFDRESNSLKINIGGNEVETFTLSELSGETSSGEIRFYLHPASKGMSSKDYSTNNLLETKVVKFTADRSSSPFVAEIDLDSGTEKRLQFDSFSSFAISSE